MRMKVWVIIMALISVMILAGYALYLALQVRTDADIIADELELIKKLDDEESSKLAERSKNQARQTQEEGRAGESDSRP